jgi:ribose transport system substrate-binding protein
MKKSCMKSFGGPIINLMAVLALASSFALPGNASAQGVEAEGKKFAYLAPGFDIPFWRTVSKSVTDTLKSEGGTVTSFDSHNDAATQLKNAQDAIAQGVAGIIISPTDSSTAPSVLALAARAHVPVVIADVGTNSGDYVSFVVSDNETGA